jgi:hypothetical protein
MLPVSNRLKALLDKAERKIDACAFGFFRMSQLDKCGALFGDSRVFLSVRSS